MAARLSRLSKGLLAVTGGLALLSAWTLFMDRPAVEERERAVRPPLVCQADPSQPKPASAAQSA